MLKGLIDQGVAPPGLTHIAGPPNSGKTTILYSLSSYASVEKRALIFDCELKFSSKRLLEIIQNRNKTENLQHIYVVRIRDLKQQVNSIMNIHNYLHNQRFYFIAINGITDHFRILEKKSDEFELRKIFALQLAYLKKISYSMDIPIIFTNQVTKKLKAEHRTTPILNNIISLYSDNEIIISRETTQLFIATCKTSDYHFTITDLGIELL